MATTQDHYARAVDHIQAVLETRESLRELYRDEYRDSREVARLNHDLGDALKLADVHATLAVVEAIDNLVDCLDERLGSRVVSHLGPDFGQPAPGGEQLGELVVGPVVGS